MSEKEYLEFIQKWKKDNECLIKSKKCKKVFCEILPKTYGFGVNKNKLVIDWENTKGYTLYFIYNNIDSYIKIVTYKNGKLAIKYNNEIYYINCQMLRGCKIGRILSKKTSNFRAEIGETFKDDKRDITIIDKEYRKDKRGQNWKWYKYTCNKCHWTEGWIVESNLLQGKGCLCCDNKIVVEGINDIPTTAPWMVKYFQGGYEEAKKYTKRSNQSIYPRCPICGRIRNKPINVNNLYRTKSIGCSCGDGISYPNKFMYNVLEQLGIDFTEEYTPDWIGDRRYDFYIPSINKIIEMDGGFHNKDNTLNGQTAEESQFIDNKKDRLANEHGIEVIRIDCDYDNNDRFKYIKNSIKNKLHKVLYLNKINWVKANVFALRNFVKESCDIKRDNPEMTTNEIGNILGFNRNTICCWLKQGSELGWCNYNPEEESKKGKRKLNKTGRPIICVETGQIFNSSAECSRESEKVFGIKIKGDFISRVCRGERCHTKGYHFKFI